MPESGKTGKIARPSDQPPPLWRWFLPVVAGLLVLLSFFWVGDHHFGGYILDLGSIGRPGPRHARFLALWSGFGTLIAILFAIGFTRLFSVRRDAPAETAPFSDKVSMIAGALAGFLVPLGIRSFILDGAPLTDDESAYRFLAELLASGRLSVPSPPMKLFFDHGFMINDGQLYPLYFIGWPALMVPGVWIGQPGLMNPLYSALTVPGMFLVLRRLAGSRWARVGTALYLTSPMLMVAAATEMSHTTCLMALVWLTWFTLRSRDAAAPWWSHAGVACFFGASFLIRPTSAIGIGLPLLAWWACGAFRADATALRARLLAFSIPALLLGAVFFAVNRVQNGSFTTVSYQRALQYAEENHYRFSLWPPGHRVEYVNLRFHDPAARLTVSGLAVFFLNFDLFGWPSSFLFALAAGFRRHTWLPWSSFLFFLATHAFLSSPGIDTFGPVHYFETAWPLLVLTVLGIASSSLRAEPSGGATRRAQILPSALAAGLVLSSLSGYTPVRLAAIARIADDVNTPFRAIEEVGIRNAVIFAPRPFSPACRSHPTHHFLLWRPNNDPDLKNSVLWVNHIDLDQDRKLMEHFPTRRGYVMQWRPRCELALLPLEQIRPGTVPDGFVGGTDPVSSPARGAQAGR